MDSLSQKKNYCHMAQIYFGSGKILGVRYVYPEELASFGLVLGMVMWMNMQYTSAYMCTDVLMRKKWNLDISDC